MWEVAGEKVHIGESTATLPQSFIQCWNLAHCIKLTRKNENRTYNIRSSDAIHHLWLHILVALSSTEDARIRFWGLNLKFLMTLHFALCTTSHTQ